MKRYFRNIIAMLLAAVFIMSAVPAGAVTVHPLDSMNVVTLTIPTESEANPNGWGRPDLEFMGGWVHNGSWRKVVYCRDSRIGQVVYCIEPGRPIDADTQYGDHDESYWENHPGNDTIDADTVKKHIGRILAYGYLGNGNPEWNSANSAHAAQMANAIATQLLVWEVIVGERDESFGHIDATQYGKNNVIEEVMEENPIRQQILSAYNSIVSSVRNHLTLPSFCTADASDADPFNMEWNGSAWTIELTDANNVLSDYEFTGNVSGMTFTKSGNKLTVTSPAMPEGEVQINASRIGSERRGVITWTGGNNQTTVSYGATVSDPVNGCFKLIRSGAGSLHLVKTAEDGNIAGIGFSIEGQGQSIHRVTDANGIIDISTLVPGTYTVTEDESELYAPQAPQTVTIVSGETATVTFHNTLRKGGLHLVKTSEDGNVSGIGFTISGNGVNVHRVTDANGVIDIADLQPGTYTVTEDESELYAPQAPQTVTIVSGETATVSFYNTIRRGGLHLAKTAEDGNVSGIGFTISGNGVNVHRVTDANGVIDIADLQPGTYTVTEDESELYAPQPPQTVTIVSGETATVTFHNTLRKGGLHLVKTSEDGNVSGIGFTISGNGVNVHRVTDANGVIDIADLQPGTYTVTEDESELYAPQPPQTVTIASGETATVTFHNTLRKGGLHLVKTSEDGIVANIGFTISGNGVSVHRVTDADGVIDISTLVPGTYTVTEDESELYAPQAPQTVTIVSGETATVSFHNTIRRGGLHLVKTAEDGNVSGIGFTISGNGKSIHRITDDNGVIDVNDLLPGVYTVTEDESEFYAPQAPQTVTVSYGETATVSFYNTIRRGGLHLVKTAEDGNVSGIGFTISGNGKSIHRITDDNGVIDVNDLLPGVYTVTEDESELYAPQAPQTVTVSYGETATVTFRNILRRGGLKVSKTAEDGLVEGLTFHLYGTADCGLPVDEYAVTNEKGIAVFENVLIGSGYILEEVDTPDQYVIPDSQTAVIEWNEVSGHNFENKLKRGGLHLVKTAEDGNVAGIGFTIEGNGISIHRFTDENGVIDIDGLLPGVYTVTEDASELYAPQDSQTVTVVADKTSTVTFNNTLRRGALKVTKTAEDGLVEGLIFHLYGTADCGLPVDEYAVTDASGTAVFENILIGSGYVLEEVDTPDQYVVPDDQTAVIEWNEVSGHNFENKLKRGSIKGYKLDREIGKPILGALFGLFAEDEVDFIEANALMLAKSDENGVFLFENIICGSYLVCELRPAEGYLDNDTVYPVTVDENGAVIEITVVNDMIPEISTNAKIDGEKDACATDVLVLVDTVEYKHLIPGREYTLRGVLMDKFTGEAFTENGEKIVSEVSFILEAPCGSIDMLFTFDARLIKTETRIVVFECLYSDGVLLASHEDINDADQTVTVLIPRILTEASIDGQKEAFNTGIIKVEDKVSYFNLTPGREYTLRGRLMDKATGRPFNVNGRPIAAQTTFTPDARNGEVILAFAVPSECFTATTDLVVFERLYRENTEIASHEDIDDESQTVRVYVPSITTTAVIDGQKEAFNTGIITVEDKVFFEGLIPGREYTVRGVLMNKATGEPFMVEGEPVSAEVAFVAEASSGEITLTFTVPSEYFDETTDLVAFERLFYGKTEIASHEDIEDESQTVRVYFPKVWTTATIDGQKAAFNTGIITVEDKVFFEGLIPGREYTVRGVLMNKATGEPFMVDGEPISAEVTFIAEASDGEVVLTFTFDARLITEETQLVAFERLFCDETEIASHEDIEDEDQTVTVKPKPDIPKTGDTDEPDNIGIWIGLCAIALGGAVACMLLYFRNKKNGGEKEILSCT